MRLLTLRDGTRDGELGIACRDGARLVSASRIAATLQAALDDWEHVEPALRELADAAEHGRVATRSLRAGDLHAPLPRAYEWVDGSAFINHIVLVRKARGAEPPKTLETDPLVYQGGSSVFLGPTDDIVLGDVA